MSNETALVTIPTNQLPSDEIFAASTKAGDWLSRLQLMTSTSKECKKGKFPINHYALVDGQNMVDLGESVDCIVLGFRPKALDMSGEQIISLFRPKVVEGEVTDQAFKAIMDKSGEKDSQCMYGPEFLVWVPVSKQFATFFMGSKSSRREAAKLKNRIGFGATLGSILASNKKYEWYTPLVDNCSTPLDPPNADKMTAQLEKFNNPPESEIEVAEESAKTERAR
ncbi:MAG: hypothetical protein M0R80_13205 [Proteobacteria bacterium]|jgi:hypothetical protein|nr:hypothetical protein [Pseudomonadota bacterium]